MFTSFKESKFISVSNMSGQMVILITDTDDHLRIYMFSITL